MRNVLATALALSLSLLLVGSCDGVPTFPLQEATDLEALAFEEAAQFDAEDTERADRMRRVTCDLLSVSLPIGSLNHAACAAHCLAIGKGYRGGRCVDGVCHCRR